MRCGDGEEGEGAVSVVTSHIGDTEAAQRQFHFPPVTTLYLAPQTHTHTLIHRHRHRHRHNTHTHTTAHTHTQTDTQIQDSLSHTHTQSRKENIRLEIGETVRVLKGRARYERASALVGSGSNKSMRQSKPSTVTST